MGSIRAAHTGPHCHLPQTHSNDLASASRALVSQACMPWRHRVTAFRGPNLSWVEDQWRTLAQRVQCPAFGSQDWEMWLICDIFLLWTLSTLSKFHLCVLFVPQMFFCLFWFSFPSFLICHYFPCNLFIIDMTGRLSVLRGMKINIFLIVVV